MLSFHDKKVIARDTKPTRLELLYVVTISRDNRSQPNHNAEGRPLWHARPGCVLASRLIYLPVETPPSVGRSKGR